MIRQRPSADQVLQVGTYTRTSDSVRGGELKVVV
jgi:hypothetical protein